ncbi:hypothetical protein HW555_000464 [Spodoptera exigua]|uniref:Uncharacterized protein n=1 Tax=Spodoptera exigua TaxID=7107 RepID=A0A835GRL8_SPOEX|nr:hypothetical protein HW555_000464 [Spodoptera exigua]
MYILRVMLLRNINLPPIWTVGSEEEKELGRTIMADEPQCSSGLTGKEYISSERGRPILLRGGKIDNRTLSFFGHTQGKLASKLDLSSLSSARGGAGRGVDKGVWCRIKEESFNNCVRDHAGNEIKKEISTWKVESGQGVLPLQTIYNEGVNRLKDRGLNLLTRIPNFNNVTHGLYNSRRKEFGIDNIKPKTVTDVKVPVKYNDFLMADYQEGARRILIFSSKEAREKLKTVKHFFADGTFECVVPPFVQMYSIHGDLGSTEKSTNIKPLIYALALSKKAKSLHILKNRACKRHVALCAALALLPEQATDEGWFYIMEDWSEENEKSKRHKEVQRVMIVSEVQTWRSNGYAVFKKAEEVVVPKKYEDFLRLVLVSRGPSVRISPHTPICIKPRERFSVMQTGPYGQPSARTAPQPSAWRVRAAELSARTSTCAPLPAVIVLVSCGAHASAQYNRHQSWRILTRVE